MATQLNWRPDGGIVAFVPEDTSARVRAPAGSDADSPGREAGVPRDADRQARDGTL